MERSEYLIIIFTRQLLCLLAAEKIEKSAYERLTVVYMQPVCSQLQCRLHTAACMQTAVYAALPLALHTDCMQPLHLHCTQYRLHSARIDCSPTLMHTLVPGTQYLLSEDSILQCKKLEVFGP